MINNKLNFIKEVNNKLKPISFIKVYKEEVRPNSYFIQFILCIRKNYYIDPGILNANDKFENLIYRLGKKYFKCEPNFNNIRQLFWFYIDK